MYSYNWPKILNLYQKINLVLIGYRGKMLVQQNFPISFKNLRKFTYLDFSNLLSELAHRSYH